MDCSSIEIALAPVKSVMYQRMPHADKLNLVTLDSIIELVATGHHLHVGIHSKYNGVLNEIGVTPMAFNVWLMEQDSGKRDTLNAALLTQSLTLKHAMLESAVESVGQLDDIVASRGIEVKDKISAINSKASVAMKVLTAMEIEHIKMEQEKPHKTREVHAHITSSPEARERLLKIRQEKTSDE